jgi:hypothetical protein
MMGGELAAHAALTSHPVSRAMDAGDERGCDLGWVMDWLYGEAALPPLPLPPTAPAFLARPAVHAETVRGGMDVGHRGSAPRGGRRRTRQLALL